MTTFATMLTERVKAYVALRRSLGFAFQRQAAILRALTRKDRLVPVHSTTLTVLRNYARHRDAVFPAPKDHGFFLSSRGTRLSPSGLTAAFGAASKLAGFDSAPDGGRALRPHDLRHRFAVTRPVQHRAIWHRENADVQALLPMLATYLGHARYPILAMPATLSWPCPLQ